MRAYHLILGLLCSAQFAAAQLPGKVQHTEQILLPNGWKLSPAGHSINLGDLPLNMQVSSGGKYVAVNHQD